MMAKNERFECKKMKNFIKEKSFHFFLKQFENMNKQFLIVIT